MQDFLVFAEPEVMRARAAWLECLAQERRLARLTVAAYERDSRQFLLFLTGHLGGPPDLDALSALKPADFRAFLARRRTEGASPRSLGRVLAGVRSSTFLNGAGSSMQQPRVPCARRARSAACRVHLPLPMRAVWLRRMPSLFPSPGLPHETGRSSACSMAAACAFRRP